MLVHRLSISFFSLHLYLFRLSCSCVNTLSHTFKQNRLSCNNNSLPQDYSPRFQSLRSLYVTQSSEKFSPFLSCHVDSIADISLGALSLETQLYRYLKPVTFRDCSSFSCVLSSWHSTSATLLESEFPLANVTFRFSSSAAHKEYVVSICFVVVVRYDINNVMKSSGERSKSSFFIPILIGKSLSLQRCYIESGYLRLSKPFLCGRFTHQEFCLFQTPDQRRFLKAFSRSEKTACTVFHFSWCFSASRQTAFNAPMVNMLLTSPD